MFKLAGPICEGFQCLMLLLFIYLYKYWWLIFGSGLILIGLNYWVVNRKRGSKNIGRTSLLIFAAGLSFFILKFYLLNFYPNRLQAVDRNIAKIIDYDIYQPTYLPKGARLDNQGFGMRESGNPFFLINYALPSGDELWLRQFNRTKTKGADGNCGPFDTESEYTESTDDGCRLLGATESGLEIFASYFASYYNKEKPYETFSAIGNTKITMGGELPSKNEEILKIFNSLEKNDSWKK